MRPRGSRRCWPRTRRRASVRSSRAPRRGCRRTRAQCVDADALGGMVERHRLREQHDGALRGRSGQPALRRSVRRGSAGAASPWNRLHPAAELGDGRDAEEHGVRVDPHVLIHSSSVVSVASPRVIVRHVGRVEPPELGDEATSSSANAGSVTSPNMIDCRQSRRSARRSTRPPPNSDRSPRPWHRPRRTPWRSPRRSPT